VPLYVSKHLNTHVLVGHPIVADAAGQELFLEVTQLSNGTNDKPARWHVAVNNPLDTPVTTTLRQTMPIPGLEFATREITVQPGEYQVLKSPEN